ncbi:MAG: hypothetical protein P1R58_08365, partial [bacterium]|nr:hypothetical protein [bacterium]
IHPDQPEFQLVLCGGPPFMFCRSPLAVGTIGTAVDYFGSHGKPWATIPIVVLSHPELSRRVIPSIRTIMLRQAQPDLIQ